MENIVKTLEEKVSKINGKRKLQFPFPKLQIDQSNGLFVMRDGENVSQLGETIELYFLKKYGEYIYYSPDEERITRRTTIEVNPKECRELHSGLSVEELREAGYDMKFVASIVSFLVKDNEVIPVVLQLKGATLKAYIDATSNKDVVKRRNSSVFKLTLEKKKKGRVEYYVPLFELRPITEDEAKKVLEQMDEAVERFEEFRTSYNTSTSVSSLDEDVSSEEESIEFVSIP